MSRGVVGGVQVGPPMPDPEPVNDPSPPWSPDHLGTRAALLPALDNQFCLDYWMRNFATWEDSVDELWVYISGPREVTISHPKLHLIRDPKRAVHGDALQALVRACTAQTLLLCEEDGYVREPERVELAFQSIEADRVDIIGSPRGPASQELIDAAWQKFGEMVAPDQEVGTGFWPCFFFVRRDLLMRTNLEFTPQMWSRGEVVPGLDYTVREEYAADEVMVCLSWQLRALNPRVELESQQRLGATPLMRAHGPWFHVGSIGLDGFSPQDMADRPDEYARRVSWHLRWGEDCEALIEAVPLDRSRIAWWMSVFDIQVTWD